MAEYRTIRMTFWTDPYIEGLPPEAKLLYVYLFTSPHTNNLGMLEISRRKIAFETGLDVSKVDECVDLFEQDGKALADGQKIWLTRFIKHQTMTSPKLTQALRKMLPGIGSKVICDAVCERYPHIFDGSDTLPIPYAEGTHGVAIPPRELEVGIGSLKGKRNEEVKAPPLPPRMDSDPEDPDLPNLADYVSERDPMSPAERQNRVHLGGLSGFRDFATFEKFWEAYPWQVGKRKAFLAWQAVEGSCRNITPEHIIAAIKAQVANGHHFDSLDGKPAIPNPANWLDQGRWDDAIRGSPGSSSDPTAGMTLAQKLEWARTQQ